MTTAFDIYITPARKRSGLWRTALGLVLILAAYLALNAAAFLGLAVLISPDRTAQLINSAQMARTPAGAIIALLSFVPLVLAILAVTWALHRRAPATLWGRDWIPDFLRAIIVLGLLFGAAALLPGSEPPATPGLPLGLWLKILPLALVLVALQTLAEELLFRGYLTQQLAARFRARWIGLTVPAALFGLAHTAPSLMGPAWPVPVLAAFAFGLIAADLTRRHGNIGAAWGLHLANNTVAILFMASDGPLSGLALFRGPDPLTQMMQQPGLLVMQLLPLLFAWAILRQPMRR